MVGKIRRWVAHLVEMRNPVKQLLSFSALATQSERKSNMAHPHKKFLLLKFSYLFECEAQFVLSEGELS